MTLRSTNSAAVPAADGPAADGRPAADQPDPEYAAAAAGEYRAPAATLGPDGEADVIRVPAQWRGAFDTFIDTGHLDPAFRNALDTDADLKEAVDHAFRRQVEALGQIGRALRAQGAAARATADTPSGSAETSRRTVQAFSSTLRRLFHAPPRERDTILDAARQDLEDARANPACAPAADRAIRSLEVLREQAESGHP